MPSAVDLRKRRAWQLRRWGRGTPAAIVSTEVLPVTFPSSPLTTRVYIALGADLTASHLTWNWLDITGYVRHDLGISVQFGRRDEFTKVTASRCQLKLENTDGRFSRRNPLSPYYGLLSRNTPIWIQTNPGSGFVDRYFGYVNDWPTRWSDESATDSYAVIQCAGVMRRLGQGENLQAPLFRTIMADNPVEYWKLEDPDGSTYGATAIPNSVNHMRASATVSWASITAAPGMSGAVAQVTLGTLTGTVNVAAPWTVSLSAKRPTDGSGDGAFVRLQFLVDGVATSATLNLAEDTDNSARDWYHYKVVGQQNGTDYDLLVWRNGTARPTVTAAGTLGNLTAVVGLTPNGAVGYGHWAVYAHTNVDERAHSDALQAFVGERAHERIARLCAEAGVPFRATSASSAAMGPQSTGTLLEVLRECEQADQGVLYEYQYGFGYQSLAERYNAAVALELDFDQRHIGGLPEPADDDQRTRNQWTIRRSGGSSATYRDQASVDADGLYDDADTVNVETDGQLSPHAGWRVRLGTVDEDRWPRLPLKLHGTAALIPGWLATPFGARVQVANPPPQMAPDTIDAVIEGYTEHWDTVQWNVSLNTSPASPFQVGIAGASATDGSWTQTSGTELAADITSSATTFDVTITAGPLWTTSPGGELIVIGGEVMALDAVAGASSPQTFTVTRSINGVVKAHPITGIAAARAVKVYRPLIAAL